MSLSEISQEQKDNSKNTRRKVIDSDEEELIIPNQLVETNKEETSLNQNKRSKPAIKETKKRKLVVEDLEKVAYDIINFMKQCYKTDIDLNLQNKPSFTKIENIEDICNRIMKKEYQEVLLKMGILNEIKIWLEPLPDNSLPNPKIKKCLLDLLSMMKISKNDLLGSGIGKIVHFYSKNTKESLEIRKLAIKIMKKWKHRIIREETM